jgi:hypothetical protein
MIKVKNEQIIQLSSDTFEKARAAAPGWDIYLLEQEWREWMKEPPKFPDAAFVGFCRKRYEKQQQTIC